MARSRGALAGSCRTLRRRTLALPVCRAALRVGFRAASLLGLAGADLGDALGVRHFEPLGAHGVVEVRNRHARQAAVDRLLDRANVSFLFR
jgi:hypothetical protein